jgi:hypothetical protein
MLVGHFAAAFVANRVEPHVSLGTMMLAAMLPDVLWPVFSLAGLERLGGYIGYSHSLLMDVVWAVLFSGAYFAVRRNVRGSWVLFALVMSHWVLDVISHPPDMPLAPGISTMLGFGLWHSLPATLLVEGGFWLLAIVVYVRTTTARSSAGIYGFWPVIALLTWIWYKNITTPPAPNGVGSLTFFSLVIAWAYWMNRCRPSSQKRLV